MMLFAAVHESVFGTKRTLPNVRLMSAIGPSRPIAFWWPTVAFGA
jgi:hypothetical protein